MLKKFTFLFLLAAIAGLYSCKESITDNPIGKRPPTTSVFLKPDSVISQQQSKLKLYWTGDAPDGLVIGFYFSFGGNNWTFTSKNDSLFSLQIGAVDTSFIFKVSAVDNSGNGLYDTDIFQNNIHFGPEPYIDLNKNGQYDLGEPYTDIGLIDPTPAEIKLPIKNTSPAIKWNVLSTHPDTSYPVMSFGWDASDIDGNETIQHIEIAMNDTTKFISLNGTVRTITVRARDFSKDSMEVLINGDPSNQPRDPNTGKIIKLPGLLYNANNVFYVRAVDISSAKSAWINSSNQPAPSKNYWYVKKPKGKLIIIDDHKAFDNAPAFYTNVMSGLNLNNKYDVYDIGTFKLPYLNITFLETIKLFSAVIWYSDNDPSLDLANATTQKYSDAGGKILFSLQFPQTIDLSQIQGFLPAVLTDSSAYNPTLLAGRILSDTSRSGYPKLTTTESLPRARGFYLSNTATPVYYLSDNASYPRNILNGYLGYINSAKTRFFIAIPLHKANGTAGSVEALLNKVLFQDFNLNL